MTLSRVKTTLRTLVGRIFDGIRANRGLFAAVLAIGFLEAFFTKAPLALVKFLMDALDNSPSEPTPIPLDDGAGWLHGVAQSAQDQMESGFNAFAMAVNDGLGLGFQDRMVTFVGCAAGAVILGLIGSVTIYGMTVLSRFFAAKIVVDLRNQVLDHILRLPLRFFTGRRMGELISNITTDTAVLTRSFTLACDHAITDPLNIMFNFVLLLIFVPDLAWVLIPVVPLMALPMLKTGRRIHKSSSKSLAAMGDSTESMNQVLTGIRTVKSFQLEDERLQEFRAANDLFLHRTKRMLQAKGLSQGLMFAGYQITFAFMLGFLGWLVTNGDYELSDITMAIIPLATTYNHVKRLVRSYNILNESVGAMEGIEAILAVDPDAGLSESGKVLDDVEGEIEMRGVSFAYDSETVLNNVSFCVEPGRTYAFVGPSGAGKSTAMDLLARFHDPTDGQVLIDGHDLRELNLPSYRKHVAMVSQQPFLFNTTLYDNIAYGRRGATEAEVHEAAQQAQIHDFITSLPDGYQTIAGERGSKLSGGQMQRITIARAILRNPRILFLDEATSALDSEGEKAVQKALRNLMGGRTSIVIAHRLATIQNADQILVMENGHLVEQGSHDELLALDGLYSRLCQLQQL
ncbi:MAG: ABC transporter ATP-binding protein [Planctomycetota bacterium]|nr:ABC transporter ATP-binding protein [Planctomycetota bacterium]